MGGVSVQATGVSSVGSTRAHGARVLLVCLVGLMALLGTLTLGAAGVHAAVGDTCDPYVDPNCVPPPPPSPGCGVLTCPPPVPIPCTSPSDPLCHIWPDPIHQTEQCVGQLVGASQCPTAHIGVLNKDTGPITIPVPNAVDLVQRAIVAAEHPTECHPVLTNVCPIHP
jgi:hypothetical protein